jgi:hypothetical protein
VYSSPRERVTEQLPEKEGGIYFTFPLPRDDMGNIHTVTQTEGRDLRSTSLRWVQVPGSGIQKLMRVIHRHTEIMEIEKAKSNRISNLMLFFEK